MSRPISLAHLTCLGLSPPDLIDVATRCGYSSVDLRLAPATSTDIVYPMFGDTGMRWEVLSRMRDTGISVYDVEIIRLMRDTVATEYEQLFEAAAALGAKRIKVVGIEGAHTGLFH